MMNSTKIHSHAMTKKSIALTYRISLTVRKFHEGIAPPVAGNSTNSLKYSSIVYPIALIHAHINIQVEEQHVIDWEDKYLITQNKLMLAL